MTRLYQSMYRSSAKYEAQDQLAGRTHYCDSETLRFHHARIINCDVAAGGLLFWLVESIALDYQNTRRGFRYVIFDVFGNVVSRVAIAEAFKTSKAANKACRLAIEGLDALVLTKAAIKSHKAAQGRELSYLQEQIKRIG